MITAELVESPFVSRWYNFNDGYHISMPFIPIVNQETMNTSKDLIPRIALIEKRIWHAVLKLEKGQGYVFDSRRHHDKDSFV